jgi:hypothetical protein
LLREGHYCQGFHFCGRRPPARVFDAFQRLRREAVKSLHCRPGGGAADKELRKTGAITAIKLK